jgi:hypothetical protein
VRKTKLESFMPVVVSVLEHHLSTGTSDNVLIYGVVRTLEDMIVSVILRHFPERLNFVSYWGATKADIGGQGQCVRPNSPTVILVTAAAATGINLEDTTNRVLGPTMDPFQSERPWTMVRPTLFGLDHLERPDHLDQKK